MTVGRRCTSSPVAGFTLLEALVAMALTGIVLGAVATITAQWLPNWNRGFARVQGSELLALGLERLVADVAAAKFIPATRKSQQPLFEGTEHSVTFVRSALALSATPGLEIVRIAEIAGAPGPNLIRAQARFVPIGGNNRDQPKFVDPVVLLRAPYLVALSYAGPDRIWKATWQQENVLPAAIRVIVRNAATQRELGVSTATLVHTEIPAKCLSAKAIADCRASLEPPSIPAEGVTLRSAGGPL
jgi:general secretion pathway protein J